MKKIFIIGAMQIVTLCAYAQLMMTKTATISFHSHTLLEDIDAVNNNVLAVLDVGKKQLAFSCLMKQFSFKKKLMQEHFNENYVESDKYPKATFSGTFTEEISFDKAGSYQLNVKGKLNIHGVTKEINVPATIVIKDKNVTGSTTFKLNPTDYNISIPFIVRDKIEKENTVKVNVEWTPKF